MRDIGARILPVSASQALNTTRLLGGPVRLRGYSFSDGLLSGDTQASGQQTAPGAGATIASVSLGNGTYQVEWSVELSGTPGAGEVNNVGLFIGVAQIAQSVNLGAAGTYGQPNAQAQVTFGPLLLAAKATGAGTAGAVYSVNLIAIPVSGAGGTINDGKMVVYTFSVNPGSSDGKWLGRDGIRVETELSVTGSLGTISGTLYYDLPSDYAESEHHHAHGRQ